MYVRSSSLLANNSVAKYVRDAPTYHSCTFFLKMEMDFQKDGYGVFKPMIHKKLEKLQWPIVLAIVTSYNICNNSIHSHFTSICF